MSYDEMAAMLRQAGWTVLPPRDNNIPEPLIGQIWAGTRLEIKNRTVVRFHTTLDCIIYKHRDSCCEFITSRKAWRAWARRNAARPI